MYLSVAVLTPKSSKFIDFPIIFKNSMYICCTLSKLLFLSKQCFHPSQRDFFFIIKEIDTACSYILGNVSATPVLLIMSPSLASCFQ